MRKSGILCALTTILLGGGLAVVPASASQVAEGHGVTGAALKSASTSPLLGVDLYARTAYSLADATNWGSSDVKYLHNTLKAQALGIVWNLSTTSATSDEVYAAKQTTLSSSAVAELTRLAESAGMAVQYRPIIRIGPVADWNKPGKSWEGYIKPKNQKAWFTSLYTTDLPYLKIAQQLGVHEFVIGSELVNLAASKQWPWFLKKVASVYHGIVSFASSSPRYILKHRQLPPMKFMGVDAYPRVKLANSATQQQVTSAWENYFKPVPSALLKSTSMDEISILALTGAYDHPYEWNASGSPDPTVQVQWFTAACETAAHYDMRSLYFYELPLTPSPSVPSKFPGFFAGKPGGQAIASCPAILATAGR